MKKAGKILVHKNSELKEIQMEEFDPPSRKDLINNLLSSLNDSKNHYESEFLTYEKSGIPKDFLHLFWGLKQDLEDFLERYQMVESHTLPGKTQGRNINFAAREIALKVVKDYRTSLNDPNAIPTGEYLCNTVNEIINAMALAGEPCPMDVKLRTCHSWTKEMKEGKFEENLRKLSLKVPQE